MLKINRNIFWSNLFIDFLISQGLKSACISPGSRSTPLTIVTATNKSIKSFPIIDERSSAFFALGLSKSANKPTLIITTSGTAVAELYPAIIEAYQNRIPLIVCTADRPSYLRFTGSNQTINQNKIFQNHIRFSADIPSMDINKRNIKKFLSIVYQGIEICLQKNIGPVHFNFQFEKPFEPDSPTDKISFSLIDYSNKKLSEIVRKEYKFIKTDLEFEFDSINLITIGSGNFGLKFISLLNKFSKSLNVPIFADFSSGLRSNSLQLDNLIYNYDSLLRNSEFQNFFKPKNVIHFGRNITSTALEDFLVKSKSKRIIVNDFGDRFDSTKKGKLIKSEPIIFMKSLFDKNLKKNSEHSISKMLSLDSQVEEIKSDNFSNRFSEVTIINIFIKKIPDNSAIFIGNSLPIRDFDFFVSSTGKKIDIFTNRGASGIDGLISTAAGICKNIKKTTYLILGDLSFYYDMNSLLSVKKFNIPLKILIINNNGGRIFEYLPINNYKNVYNDFFLTPTKIDFKKVAESFSIQYYLCDNLQNFEKNLDLTNKLKSSVILEVKVNPFYTKSLKNKFREKVSKLISNKLS
jgi:2-succinyl-5-enolpyruvyl-6-hydroxy-3-cyclohexene-1-carboxylate synthase